MEGIYFAKEFDTGIKPAIEHKLFTVHCPDGTLVIDCLVSKMAAGILVGSLNNLMVIRDNNEIIPKLNAAMFLNEVDQIKPKKIEL